MASTTPAAMYTALRKLIKGLDPDGSAHGGESEFEYAAPGFSWDDVEDRAESDIDRRFTVHDLVRGTPQNFGSPSSYDYDGTIRVTIGHAITDDEAEGETRRDADLFQIIEELEKSGNFPSGVSLIRFVDQTVSRYDESHWVSVLAFEMYFTIAAP